jgi:hypothetical protein
MNYPTVDMTSQSQKDLLQKIQVLQNVCGFELIEIEQVSKHFKGGEGIQVPRIKKISNTDDPENPSESWKFTGEWDGGPVAFVKNPIPRISKGTGNVAFLVMDDVDILSIGALSGEPTGWNLEWLASMYGMRGLDGKPLFKIVDPAHEALVVERYNAIQKKLEELKPERDKATKRLKDLSQIEINRRQGISNVSIDVQQLKEAVARASDPTASTDIGSLMLQLKEMQAKIEAMSKPIPVPDVEKIDDPAVFGTDEEEAPPAFPQKNKGGRPKKNIEAVTGVDGFGG